MRKINRSACASRKEARNKFQARFNGKLRSDVIIHHKDRNPFNNNPDNLELMMRSKHSEMHFKEQMDKYWNEDIHSLYLELEHELRVFNNFLY